MKFICYGCRGSYPVTHKEKMLYGGNTTCYFLEEGDSKIIIDGGTGITKLGRYLYGLYFPLALNLDIFLTHAHWDHIMGLPLFYPFYYDSNSFTIYAPGEKEANVSKMVLKLHQVGNSSIPMERLQANIEYKNLGSGDKLDKGDFIIESYQLNHPSMDLGYKITSKKNNSVVSILTDIAPIEDNYLAWGWQNLAKDNKNNFENKYNEGLINFIKGSDIVIHDTHFAEKDIIGKVHWGHSTPEMALKLVKEGGCKVLMLTHHNPDYDDNTITELYESTKNKGKKLNIDVLVAKERDKLDI